MKMAKKINHIGIAVKNIEEASKFYIETLGLEDCGIEEVASQKVKVAFFQVGESRIELLEPTSEDSPIAKFIEKKGVGIHHIAYEVENVVEELKKLENSDIRLIDKTPRSGAHGTSIAFLHPKTAGGVLVELCQPKSEE